MVSLEGGAVRGGAGNKGGNAGGGGGIGSSPRRVSRPQPPLLVLPLLLLLLPLLLVVLPLLLCIGGCMDWASPGFIIAAAAFGVNPGFVITTAAFFAIAPALAILPKATAAPPARTPTLSAGARKWCSV